ncbi:histidine kinase [uncultured Azohydromonas sp.]|jgi:Signal transduction histidine kinase|uniref:sensor histidine kinase n=1 Tax=uncultured Azohydromonas sp. TaxID=487342 RepID=UPI0026273700|nr:histidine kinase [uncultured Azohydromonas sp.]
MDLRRTLVTRLALSFAGLIVVFSIVWLHDLREDTRAEQLAASRLVDLMQAGDGLDAQARVVEVLAQGGLRHVTATLLQAGEASPPAQTSAWLGLLGLSASPVTDHRIALGDRVLLIRPDPNSELHEKLGSSLQVLLMLLVFCAACLGMTWYAVHRALSPVKELEAGLLRLEQGESTARLPRFELREFAAIAGVMDRVATSLNRAREGQRRLTRQLMELQDKERRELAAELHDEFGQSLTAISASAAYIERHAASADAAVLVECAREIGNESRRISGHVRHMLSSLRPYGIEDSGMRETLSELVAAWRPRLPDRRIESRIDDLPPLPAANGLALYRSLQEALTNCVRHSGADVVNVECLNKGTMILLRVTDNGRGTAAQILDQAGGGLLGLRERLTMVGGSFSIQDAAQGGVALTAYVPIAGKENQ